MGELFAALSRAVEGSGAVALLAAFSWGMLSIILSPCHLASIPLIVGYIGEQGRVSTGRACAIATLFALGILATIACIGAITAAAGRLMGDIGPYGSYVVAVVFLLAGLHLLDVIPLPLGGSGATCVRRRGFWTALGLGLVFGIALGPCTFAFMAPVLGVTFRVGSTAPIYAGGLLLAYGVGHCGVIVAAGTSTQWVQTYLNWNERGRGAALLRKVCGILVILGGLWLIYSTESP
jgi:cytochrome c-type biogenesis protein